MRNKKRISSLYAFLYVLYLKNAVSYTVLISLNFQGVLSVHGSAVRCVVQAVQELYDSHFTSQWLPSEQRKNIVVFIGKNRFFLKF